MSGHVPPAGLVTAGETMGLLVQATPRAPRNGEPMSFGIGGSESNVAIGVRRLGVPATWIGRVGDDPAGALILRELRAEQVEPIAAVDPAPTGLMIRWRPTALHGRVEYHRRDSAGAHLRAADIPDEVVAGAAVFHATGITLALGADPAAAVAHGMAVARAAGVLVSFDLNFRRALWTEARGGAGADRRGPPGRRGVRRSRGGGDRRRHRRAARRRARARGPGPAAGADQARRRRLPGPDRRHQPRGAGGGWQVPVLDTVGAGDAFVAGYLAELIGGATPAQRLATAVTAGAWAVTVAGDWEGMPDRRALALLDTTEPVIR